MYVSYQKVLQELAFLDCEIANKQFESGRGITDAIEHLIRELSFEVDRFRLGSWQAVTIQPTSAREQIHECQDHPDRWFEAADIDIESRTIFLSMSRYTALIAALGYILDSSLDIWLEEPELSHTYSVELLAEGQRLASGISAYISQYLWYGDVPQYDPYFKYVDLIVDTGGGVDWQPFVDEYQGQENL